MTKPGYALKVTIPSAWSYVLSEYNNYSAQCIRLSQLHWQWFFLAEISVIPPVFFVFFSLFKKILSGPTYSKQNVVVLKTEALFTGYVTQVMRILLCDVCEGISSLACGAATCPLPSYCFQSTMQKHNASDPTQYDWSILRTRDLSYTFPTFKQRCFGAASVWAKQIERFISFLDSVVKVGTTIDPDNTFGFLCWIHTGLLSKSSAIHSSTPVISLRPISQ